MGVTYSAREVFRIAVRMEENGHRFYKEAAAAAADRQTGRLFNRLAAEELEHRRTFEAMAERLPDESPGTGYGEEADLYLKAMAEAVLFGMSGRGAGAGASGVREALEVGIKSEKDAIFYYSEIHRFTSLEERPLIEKIIAEERTHLTKLFALYNR